VVRVPPSAWSTSQSTHRVRSPSSLRSTTARKERPTKRWISTERPSVLPARSRGLRLLVEAGSIEYSAVNQPWPLPFRNGGTPSFTTAVHSTRVFPKLAITEPGTWSRKPRSKLIGRGSAGVRS
jgi:hypothetical protein